MELAQLASALAEQIGVAAAMFDSDLLMAALLFVLTTGAVGLCVPGLLMPISFSAGLMLESWLAVPVVAAGAVLGSQVLFVAARCGMGGTLEKRFAGRLDRFTPHLESYGLAYVTGLRVLGTPHALVTLASAASPLRQGRFALASLLGFLPSIAVSAGAGTLF